MLHFEEHSEFVSDVSNGEKLLQNKNGNPWLRQLYEKEIHKLSHYKNWLSEYPIQDFKKKMALLICGQFRNFRDNFKKNLHVLDALFQNSVVYVFLLTDKHPRGNYSIENEKEIIHTFLHEFHFQIGFIRYVEDHIDPSIEKQVHDLYCKELRHERGSDGFAPILMYRKYVLNRFKNEYAKDHAIDFDLNLYFRCFDMMISPNIDPPSIEHFFRHRYHKNCVYGSSDTIFIGDDSSMNTLFEVGDYIHKTLIYHDEIWEDQGFVSFAQSVDSFLATFQHTYAPEIQYLAHIYYHNLNYINIRVDYNNDSNPVNKSLPFHIKHDPKRFMEHT